jgi:hypothetical protein
MAIDAACDVVGVDAGEQHVAGVTTPMGAAALLSTALGFMTGRRR